MIKRNKPFVNNILVPHFKEGIEVPNSGGVRIPGDVILRGKLTLLQVSAIGVLKDAGWTHKQIATLLRKQVTVIDQCVHNTKYFPPPEPDTDYFQKIDDLPNSHRDLEDNEGRL